jgi:hypothetical protein
MYQVSTSEYVKASEVSYDANPGGTDTNTDNSGNNSNVVITTQYSIVFNDEDGTTSDETGSYKVGRIVNNGVATYYQVATHIWIDGSSYPDFVQVTGDQNVEYDSNFSPVGDKVLGMTAQDIRDRLVQNFECNADALAAIPDNWLLVNYAEEIEGQNQPDTGFVAYVNKTYPDVHGYSFGYWVDF